jgi:hypothetical protein
MYVSNESTYTSHHHSDTRFVGDSLEVFAFERERERERERESITHTHLNIYRYIVIYILKHKVEVERERFEKARLRNVLRLRNLISAESVER